MAVLGEPCVLSEPGSRASCGLEGRFMLNLGLGRSEKYLRVLGG